MTFSDRWYRFKSIVFRNPLEYDLLWGILATLGFGAISALICVPFLGAKAIAIFAIGSMLFMISCVLWKESEVYIRRHMINPVSRVLSCDVSNLNWFRYWSLYFLIILLNAFWYDTLGLNLDVFHEGAWFFVGPTMATLYQFTGLFAFDHFRGRIYGWFTRQYYRFIKRSLSDIDYVTVNADEDTESYLDRLGVYDRMPLSHCEARKRSRDLVNSRGSERERLIQELMTDIENLRRNESHWDVDGPN